MMNKLKLNQQFKILIVTIMVGFILVGSCAYWGLEKLKINGALYGQIVGGKDLVADILPPPEYLLETHLVVHQLRFAATPSSREDLINKIGALKKDFDTRHDYWLAQHLDPSLQKPFFTDAYEAGVSYFKKIDADYVPAVRAGDSKRMDKVLGELVTLYETHRAGIDATVTIANAGNEAKEKEAADLSRLVMIVMLSIFSIALIVLFMITIKITRGLMLNLGGEPTDLRQAASLIAAGDLSFELSLKANDRTSVMAAMINMQRVIQSLVSDANMLSQAAVAGQLSTRVDASKHQGEFRKLVEGVNSTLDSVIGPLNVAAQYLDRIAKGQLPEKITASYNGDFNLIKNNLNTCIDAISALIRDAKLLSVAASKGNLTARADENQHHGDYRVIVEGMNATLVAVEKPINETVAALQRIANGDMSQHIMAEREGSYGIIKDNANLTMERLTEIVTNIKTAVESINTAAKEIAAGNTDLSQRTEEQASSLEETASSMEELASTVKQNAENAKQANQMAAAASGVAVKGGEVVGEVVSTMSAINESSRKIVDIISVIDGIAFQTNILALNAAVEAARAGEQGRGFAVVAGEVRNLAQRSAAAAKEIKQLISDSVEKVETGSKLVAQAGSTMDEVVTSVKRVTDIMAEITAASVEQSSGIDQVNQAVAQMDEVTQQNAALVEEAAAAAESLEEQAQTLIESVNVFSLPGARSNGTIRTITHRAISAPKDTSKFSFKDAVEAHTKWKARLINYVKGSSTEELDVAKVSKDDVCDLGCWIHGPATAHAAKAEYKALKSAHADFHKSVGKIVQCVHDGKAEEAQRLLGGEFFHNSNKTIKAINTLQSLAEGRAASTPKLASKLPTLPSSEGDDLEEF